MTVHFIGAGPGAPDLLTLRGRDLIAASPVCLYAGSLVPEGVLAHCPPGARIVNTAPLSLDEIIAEIAAAHAEGKDVARLHSGDLSIWSAMGEQLRRLRALGIPYSVTPGVPSFSAAAAALETELTLPGLAQTVVLTRTPGRASAMPEGEKLAAFAATGAVLAIHLSIHLLDKIIAVYQKRLGDMAAAVSEEMGAPMWLAGAGPAARGPGPPPQAGGHPRTNACSRSRGANQHTPETRRRRGGSPSLAWPHKQTQC